MAQFDVYSNPVPRARSTYPFVVAIQANFARTSLDQIVAPLVLQRSFGGPITRITPVVGIDEESFVVLIPKITGVPTPSLGQRHCSIESARSDLLAAIDYLFFGT